MKNTLDKAIQEHVEKPSLTTEQIDGLLDMQDAVLVEQTAAEKAVRKRWLAACAALLMCVISWGVFKWGVSEQSLEHRIAKEVISNHLKLKPLDVQTTSIVQARQYFTQLDFSVIKPTQMIASADTDLIGGRYCSIQGETAAQLRYQDNTASLATLYQVAYDASKFGSLKTPNTQVMDGLRVRTWIEKGVLLVSVSEH